MRPSGQRRQQRQQRTSCTSSSVLIFLGCALCADTPPGLRRLRSVSNTSSPAPLTLHSSRLDGSGVVTDGAGGAPMSARHSAPVRLSAHSHERSDSAESAETT